MNKDLIRFFGILTVILFFSYFVYPTPFYYTHSANGLTVVKINRISGNTYFLDLSGRQWVKISN